uniref:Chitin-binding type-2 domain-containing protein n=1 Tax=Plectus sambesii TaxID=2011161 RepID=A0A914WGH0_9BILA
MSKGFYNAAFLLSLALTLFFNSAASVKCPDAVKFGKGPPPEPCTHPSDPNGLPASPLEKWLTKEVFDDLFPHANIGWGPNPCSPFSYESFQIAARYLPRFGTESSNNKYTEKENTRRDVAAFLAHVIQETGENNGALYKTMSKKDADECFYRGGFFNWFEGGPTSPLIPNGNGHSPSDGTSCTAQGRYCSSGSSEIDYWYPCKPNACYFGRGALQISYNYNYGQFQEFLKTKNVQVDLLSNPNLLITKMDPPLAILASLWFYMTPQPPKPAMHDIVMGQWQAGEANKAAGFSGPIFGPTSLIINNECGGEDSATPGGPGESRRIKAFKFFCKHFQVPVGPEQSLTCKGMPVKFPTVKHDQSWQPDYSTTHLNKPCDCKPAAYSGIIPYFDPNFYPADFVAQNEANKKRCIKSIYDKPSLYKLVGQACLQFPPTGGVKTTTSPPLTTESSTRGTDTTKTTSGSQGISCNGQANDAYLRDPNNCQLFYRCLNDQPVEFNCPPPTVYNAAIMNCDYKTNVPECNNA